MLPIDPADVVRGQYTGYRDEHGVARDSDTETFIALKVGIDNWRWAGVPIYLRTGKRMAEGQRIISIAFKEAPRTMFPAGSGVGAQGPDHLTFDLADDSKVSLSFYGKRPGPGMKLDKLSMQFSTQETDTAGDVLEAYERLILDAMRGDHTLFTTAEGIESLWERSTQLLTTRRRSRSYQPGTWGPNAIHQLIAPQRVAAAVRARVARGQGQRRVAAADARQQHRPPADTRTPSLSQPPHIRRKKIAPGSAGLSEVLTWPSRGSRRDASAWWPTAGGSPSAKPGRRYRRSPFSSCALTFVVVRMILP